jgi:hypothetical protein
MSFNAGIEHWDITGHGSAESLMHIADMVDRSSDQNLPELAKQALKLCDELQGCCLSDTEQVELFYFRANAWSAIRHANHFSGGNIWAWDQTELIYEIYWLRSAIRHEGFEQIEAFRQSQILTNAGNVLSHIGRPIEAIEYWQRALIVTPNFAMGRGNLGLGLKTYACYVYDPGHAVVIMKAAHDQLLSVTAGEMVWDSHDYQDIRNRMVSEAKDIAEHIDIQAAQRIELDGFTLGRSKVERTYRRWALDNDLFLSPLNDLGSYSIAAHDVLLLPDMVAPIDNPPSLIGFFNQMKQEYVSARFLHWQGQSAEKTHYSDRDVSLVNTLDYPLYSVHIEQIKMAFRMAYSIFDKIAFFINEYWTLGIPERSINFQSVWYLKDKKGKSLRPYFITYENLPLRGLFWISKDFMEQKDSEIDGSESADLSETMEPDADALRAIRNHLEHKYLKVHDSFWAIDESYEKIDALFKDTLAYSLTRESLEAKTLRLLKLARAGLIYLSLAVHREEKLRAKNQQVGFFMPMHLPEWKPI